MENPETTIPTRKPNMIRSLVAVIAGSLVLRAAASAMGENIQFYFNAIHEAFLSPLHPLRIVAGAAHVYPISYTTGGLIIASFFVAELLGAIVLGAWSDRAGRKLFIIFGPVFGAVAVLITSVTTAIWLLVVTRLLEGLSTASNAPATLGYIAETTSHSEKLRTRVVGFYEIATIGGMALGLSLGGWLWRAYGQAAIIDGIPFTSPAFAINSLVYLASLLILWLGIHEIREVKKSAAPAVSPGDTLKRYWAILSSPKVAGFAPAWISINAVLGVWLNLSARILTDKNGRPGQLLDGLFDSFHAGNVSAAYAVFFVLGILVWTMGFGGMRRNTAMLIGTAGLFISCLALYGINLQPAANAPLIMPLAALLVVTIMVQSGFTPAALAHLADITETFAGDRGAIMGLYSVFLGLGQFVGAGLGGIFVDWGGANGMILFNALLGLFAALLLLRLRRMENREARAAGK